VTSAAAVPSTAEDLAGKTIKTGEGLEGEAAGGQQQQSEMS
jgi:hypothetical protein